MSDSDSFINEVSEEVRRDRFYAFLRRWGWLIGLVLVLIVGGTAAVEWQKYRREAAARDAGDQLRSALDTPEPAARAEALGAIARGDGGAALIARFAQAGALAEQGETARAAETLAAVASLKDAPPLYRAMANLQRVMLMGSGMDRSERLAALEGLVGEGAPFRPLALEQRALAYHEEGENERAIADLRAAIEAPGATEALTARARQLIVAFGGRDPAEEDAVPAGGDAAAPADG